MNLDGKVVIVTGGASGLGAATAARLANANAKVLIADLNDDLGNSHASTIGNGARFIHCNVCEDADATAVVEAASKMGTVTGLVNCAGIGTPGKTVGRDGPLPLESFAKVINVNLIGTFNMIRIAAAQIAKAQPDDEGERGVIINTASVAAFDGQIGQAAYAASKGGIVGMTLPIARDLARDGIRVVTIAPGLFLTPLLQGLPEEAQESLGKQVPFPPRLGRPDEFANMAMHIFDNNMLNGETIRLDGAIRMAPK